MTSRSAFSVEASIEKIDLIIRRDAGRRGLIGADGSGPGRGELLRAARDLSTAPAGGVCLMTGFFVPDESPIMPGGLLKAPGGLTCGSAETDGPPGVSLLGRVLADLDRPVRLVTDELCETVVRCAATAAGIAPDCVLVAPLDSTCWRREFLVSDFAREMTHLIAIERVGPAHTEASLRASGAGAESVADFLANTQAEDRGRCLNMRGQAIDRWTGDLHCLVDAVDRQLPEVRTIGIGDGGNEIGMGRFRWSELRSRITGGVGASIPCRIATDHAIVAGVSNWGAYALAASVCLVLGKPEIFEQHGLSDQASLLHAIVDEAGAVDGATRRREATVDGLTIEEALRPLGEILEVIRA